MCHDVPKTIAQLLVWFDQSFNYVMFYSFTVIMWYVSLCLAVLRRKSPRSRGFSAKRTAWPFSHVVTFGGSPLIYVPEVRQNLKLLDLFTQQLGKQRRQKGCRTQCHKTKGYTLSCPFQVLPGNRRAILLEANVRICARPALPERMRGLDAEAVGGRSLRPLERLALMGSSCCKSLEAPIWIRSCSFMLRPESSASADSGNANHAGVLPWMARG